MSTSLQDWLKNGWLKEHKTSREEVADLLAVADRDLAARKTAGLHNDSRFNIAYNAALQLASAALAIAGYKAERVNHHYRGHRFSVPYAPHQRRHNQEVRCVSKEEEHLRLRTGRHDFRRGSG